MTSSINSFETTSKLNLLIQNQPPPSSLSSSQSSKLKRNKFLIKVFFSLILLLALITGAIIINLIRQYNQSQEKLRLSRQTELLRIICSVTRFPDPCLNSIILLDNNNNNSNIPDDIFNASLETAVRQVTNLTTLTRALILQSTAGATESRSESALLKCSSLIDDSLNQLNRSLAASGGLSLFGVRADLGEMEIPVKVRGKIGDISRWVNDAVNDLWRCFGIVGKDNSTAVIELRSGVHEGIVHLSNIYDFLESRERIVGGIRFQQAMYWDSEDNWEYLTTLIVFSPQYFVLIFLLCLLLRIY